MKKLTLKSMISEFQDAFLGNYKNNSTSEFFRSTSVFEIGKTYRHNAGRTMKIIASIDTHVHGSCLLGECDDGALVPVGTGTDNFVNWHEVKA